MRVLFIFMEAVARLFSFLPFPAFQPPQQSHKTKRNKNFKRTPSIPSVQTGKKRRGRGREFIELSDFPPRKRPVLNSPFSIHYKKETNNTSSGPQTPLYTRTARNSNFSASPRVITATPSPPVMERKREKQQQEIIILSSDDEEESDFSTGQSPEIDYAFEVAKAIGITFPICCDIHFLIFSCAYRVRRA